MIKYCPNCKSDLVDRVRFAQHVKQCSGCEGIYFTIETTSPKEVGWFTGFTDKVGKKIYEKSKVKFYHNPPNEHNNPLIKADYVECEVVWNIDKGMWSLKWPDGTINPGPLNPKKYEVIS